MVTVRDATDADRVAVRDLHVESVRALGPRAYDDAVVRAWVGDEDRDPGVYPIGEPDVEFLVADRGGEVAGFGEVAPADPADYDVVAGDSGFDVASDGRNSDAPTDAAADSDAEAAHGEVRAVYVHPDHARRGVGTALLSELERRARKRGFEALVLTASLNAVPFYEHRGYEAVEELVYEFGGEAEGIAVVMRKRLD